MIRSINYDRKHNVLRVVFDVNCAGEVDEVLPGLFVEKDDAGTVPYIEVLSCREQETFDYLVKNFDDIQWGEVYRMFGIPRENPEKRRREA